MRVELFFHNILRAAVILAASISLSFCDKKDPDIGIGSDEEGIKYDYPGNRVPVEETRRVLLFYECGFNTLNYSLMENMLEDLPEGYVPKKGRHDDVLLTFTKFAINDNYKDVPSYLCRLYTDSEGEIKTDTLKTYPSSTIAASGETMREVLSFVNSTFPAKGYGMVFSSHGSGWLPTGYYNDPSEFEWKHRRSDGRRMTKDHRQSDIPEGSMKDDPYAGFVRSIGQDQIASGDAEMSVAEFADGIPFHLDYLLFDMCFSGGIEVAYGLKDKADYLGISPAEVLAAGMYDYTKITTFLLKGAAPDLEGLFKDSFNRYDKMTGDYRSATVTLLKTSGLESLASATKDLITNYSAQIASAPSKKIQGYFRQNRHYFYDLEDIFVQSGIPDSDLSGFRNALKSCVVYKAATPYFINSFPINTYCGLSMYLPCAGTSLLDSYYKEEAWNKAVELVK